MKHLNMGNRESQTDSTATLISEQEVYNEQFQKERSFAEKSEENVETLHTEADNWQNLTCTLDEKIDYLKMKNEDLTNRYVVGNGVHFSQ